MKSLKAKALSVFTNALTSGSSPQKLAWSCCVGFYIAFSPFPGLHTILIFVCKYLFRLNFPVLFIVASVNNPWTMLPFYSFDYAFGYWFVHSIMGCSPTWHFSLVKLFGSGNICVWSFLVGGNIIGLLFALISYPIAHRLFGSLSASIQMAKAGQPERKDIELV